MPYAGHRVCHSPCCGVSGTSHQNARRHFTLVEIDDKSAPPADAFHFAGALLQNWNGDPAECSASTGGGGLGQSITRVNYRRAIVDSLLPRRASSRSSASLRLSSFNLPVHHPDALFRQQLRWVLFQFKRGSFQRWLNLLPRHRLPSFVGNRRRSGDTGDKPASWRAGDHLHAGGYFSLSVAGSLRMIIPALSAGVDFYQRASAIS